MSIGTFLLWHSMMEGPMKKWHLEGIVSIGSSPSHKIVVPDESHMYHRTRVYSTGRTKECVVITLTRNVVSWILRFF